MIIKIALTRHLLEFAHQSSESSGFYSARIPAVYDQVASPKMKPEVTSNTNVQISLTTIAMKCYIQI